MEALWLLCYFLLWHSDLFHFVYAGYEGRAGMAAIVLKPAHKLNGTKLYNHVVKTLPAYAWPWFLRIQVSLSDIHYFKYMFLSVK